MGKDYSACSRSSHHTYVPQLQTFVKCGIPSPNWRRVAYIDTTRGPGQCPSGLVEYINPTTNQRACGRSTDSGCSSVTYPAGGNYTNICGRVRGYQFYNANAFEGLQGRSIMAPMWMVSPLLEAAHVNMSGLMRHTIVKETMTYAHVVEPMWMTLQEYLQ